MYAEHSNLKPAVLENIAYLLSCGGRVLPLVSGKKVPDNRFAPRGFYDATSDINIVEQWYKLTDGKCGFGLLVDHLIIDLDKESDINNLMSSFAKRSQVLDTWMSKTPRGYHIHFGLPEGHSLRSKQAVVLEDGVIADLRGLGTSYVVIEPTVLTSGGRYEWVEGKQPWNKTLQQAPEWLVNMLSAVKSKVVTHGVENNDEKTIDPYLLDLYIQNLIKKSLEKSTVGSRNKQCTHLAQQLRDCRLSEEEAVQLLLEGWYSQIDQRDFNPNEVVKCVASTYNTPPRSIPECITFGYIAGNGSMPEETSVETTSFDSFFADNKPSDDEEARLEALECEEVYAAISGFNASLIDLDGITKESLVEELGPGLLGDMVRCMAETGPRSQPWLSLGCALTTIGCVMGRRYKAGPFGTRSNLYTVACAPSGTGKENARVVATEALIRAKLPRLVGEQRLRSAPRIINCLVASGRLLSLVDEFGLFIQSVTAKNAQGYRAEIKDVIMTLYSRSASSYVVANPRDEDKIASSVVINQPTYCLYGTTTPEEFWRGISSLNAINGFLNRFMVFNSDDTNPKRNPGVPNALDDPRFVRIVEGIEAVNQGTPGFGDIERSTDTADPNLDINWKPYDVPLQIGALAFLDEIASEVEAMADKARKCKDDLTIAMTCRLEENCMKVAMIKAVSRDPQSPVITEHDLRWAWGVTKICFQDVINKISSIKDDRPVDYKSVLDDILNYICQSGPGGVKRSVLLMKFRMVRAGELTAILQHLKEAKMITQERYGNKNQGYLYKSTRYNNKSVSS